jgi:hypothetical protein
MRIADYYSVVLFGLQPGSNLDSFARNDEFERDNGFCSPNRAQPTRNSETTIPTHGRLSPVLFA